MHKIKTTLNTKQIDSAIKELEKYKLELKMKINLLMQTIVATGEQIARAQVIELGAKYTGDLANSIHGVYNPSSHIGLIYSGAWYAIYVEFGTGIIGSNSPHPTPEVAGWQYDINNHGEMGWIFLDEKDGKYHWTQGFASRPFMYNTARQLESLIPIIAKEVFKS